MKSLFKFIPPFAPDQSGVSSVLFGLGGIIVICDAGGCAGNVCGFDEPRWFTQKSAVFSAGLRDIDAILGRDERLIEKLSEAKEFIDAKFIAIVGTPVPAVIATDFKALRHMAESRLKLPVLSIDTTGIGLYDSGQEKAFLVLFETFAEDTPHDGPEIGIIGATPLDMPYKNYAERIVSACGRKTACYGLDGDIDSIRHAGAARINIAVSPSAIKAAEYLKRRFGTPYIIDMPITERGEKVLSEKISHAENGLPHETCAARRSNSRGGTLIIHQQVLANALREELRAQDSSRRIDVASWFMLNNDIAEENDIHLSDEDEFYDLAASRGYETVIGDPIFERALRGLDVRFLPLPHYAVSGAPYADDAAEDLARLLR